MPQRTFKYIPIVAGGTPQPLIGTTTTAIVGPAPDSRSPNVSIPVADSSIAVAGDYVVVDTGAAIERVTVVKIPDATHIIVSQLANNHASGVIVRNGNTVNSVYVQTLDGNGAAIFIGNSSAMVKATGVGIIAKLQNVPLGSQPSDWSQSDAAGGMNPISLADFWVDGTTGDQYLPSFRLT